MVPKSRCYYCGTILGKRNKSVDHKQPRSRKGTDTPENKVNACRPCNLDKGGLTLEEYRLIVAFRKGRAPKSKMRFPGELN